MVTFGFIQNLRVLPIWDNQLVKNCHDQQIRKRKKNLFQRPAGSHKFLLVTENTSRCDPAEERPAHPLSKPIICYGNLLYHWGISFSRSIQEPIRKWITKISLLSAMYWFLCNVCSRGRKWNRNPGQISHRTKRSKFNNKIIMRCKVFIILW